MKHLFQKLGHLIGGSYVRGQMGSRINLVSLTPEGNVRKQAGSVFMRGKHRYDPRLLLRREVEFLKCLGGRRAPRLLAEGEDWFEMENCGAELSTDNVPADWRKQIADIATALDAAGIVHRDIKPGNVLVMNSHIYLIDFGWAIWVDETPYLSPRELCMNVPREHIYDNRAALEWVVSLYAK